MRIEAEELYLENETYEETLNWLLDNIKETALNMREAVGENPLEEILDD